MRLYPSSPAVKASSDRVLARGSGDTTVTELIVAEMVEAHSQKKAALVHCPGTLGKVLGSVVDVVNTPFA